MGKHKLKDKLKSIAHQASHPLETLKNVANNVKTGSKKFATKAEEKAIYLPLVPLIPAMVVGLKAKGINVSAKDGVKGISLLFFHKVLNTKKNHLEHDEEYDGGLSADLAASGGTDSVSELDNKEIPPAVSKKLVAKIVDFIKKLLRKKKHPKTGEIVIDALTSKPIPAVPLSADQKAIADAAAPVQDSLAKIAGGEDSKGDTHFVNDKGDLTHTLKADGTVIETGKPNSVEEEARLADEKMYGKGFWGKVNKFFHHRISQQNLEHFYLPEEGKKYISRPIHVPENSVVDKQEVGFGSIFGRFFPASKHVTQHLESLEHTEGHCKCKHKGK